MSYDYIYGDEGAFATSFAKGKSMSQQLREERERLAKTAVKHNPLADFGMHHRLIGPKEGTRSGNLIYNGMDIGLPRTKSELAHLESLIYTYYPIPYKITQKVRFAEVVEAKRMFIFFATYYLHRPSKDVAQYLNMERSTLSSQLRVCINEIDMYQKANQIAVQLDKALKERHEQLRS
jgi:hypothetical protein